MFNKVRSSRSCPLDRARTHHNNSGETRETNTKHAQMHCNSSSINCNSSSSRTQKLGLACLPPSRANKYERSRFCTAAAAGEWTAAHAHTLFQVCDLLTSRVLRAVWSAARACARAHVVHISEGARTRAAHEAAPRTSACNAHAFARASVYVCVCVCKQPPTSCSHRAARMHNTHTCSTTTTHVRVCLRRECGV